VIENMSTFICPCCQAETAIFGAGGGEQLAAESTVPLLGRLPLHAQIREEADGGRPTVIAAPDSPLGQRYLAIGRRVAEVLAQRPKDQRGIFGRISVERAAEGGK
jgi:ATP-binding protein involved in chromosome partitioning